MLSGPRICLVSTDLYRTSEYVHLVDLAAVLSFRLTNPRNCFIQARALYTIIAQVLHAGKSRASLLDAPLFWHIIAYKAGINDELGNDDLPMVSSAFDRRILTFVRISSVCHTEGKVRAR